MKLIKLSLIAAVAATAAFADTTVAGKAQGYYYTQETPDLFKEASSGLGTAVTLDVSHKVTNEVSANFTALGYLTPTSAKGYIFESGAAGNKSGAIFNVANITATFDDTTVVVGRQLLATPMLGSFDWLLAPGSYEAATLVNGSVDNLTLVASYVSKLRGTDGGDNWVKLTDNNFALGAAYSADYDASLWYYNVDAKGYTQVYADAGMTVGGVAVAGQIVSTDQATKSTAYGIMASTEVEGVSLSAAFNTIQDATTAYVGVDSLYTSSWNVFASGAVGDNFKVAAEGEFSGVSTALSYASYDFSGTSGSEIDLILGYGMTETSSLDVIYTNTDTGTGASNALEVIATYTF